jgi:hypothetical protein
MLNAQISRARIAECNARAEREARNRQLLASSQPDRGSHRPRWRSRRAWNVADRTPIQA